MPLASKSAATRLGGAASRVKKVLFFAVSSSAPPPFPGCCSRDLTNSLSPNFFPPRGKEAGWRLTGAKPKNFPSPNGRRGPGERQKKRGPPEPAPPAD